MLKTQKRLILLPIQAMMYLLLVLLLTGCGLDDAKPAADSTPSLLPDLAAYNQYEGADVLKTGTDAGSILSTIFGSNPQLAVTAALISKMGICAHNKGIAQWRLYTRKTELTASGVILIVSKNKISDPKTVVSCLFQPSPNSDDPSALSPCASNFSFNANNDTYLVFYAGTMTKVCADFKGALPKAS